MDYLQCDLEQTFEGGKTTVTTWLEPKFAKVGKWVTIDDSPKPWKVVKVYEMTIGRNEIDNMRKAQLDRASTVR